MSSASLWDALKQTERALEATGIAEARVEARLLVCHAAGLGEQALARSAKLPFANEAKKKLDVLLAARLAGRPVQYVLGEWGFMGLIFLTDERALIPRQDTETLCEEALALIRARGYDNCLDMCCGTGCIGLSLAKLANVRVTLADRDAAALSLARENALRHGVAAALIETDLFAGIEGTFDLIACNPPYLCRADMAALQRELVFEPSHALFGGADGLDFYRRLEKEAPAHLAPGGALMMEVGAGQARAVAALFPGARITRDLNGIERVVTAFR